MRLADMHIHTTFSPDGKSSMEEQCIRFLLFRIPTIQHSQLCMLTILRINNIIGDRAAPELTA